VLLEITTGTKRIRISVLCPGGIYCPALSTFEYHPVETVERLWWIDLVSVWKDRGYSELPVDHTDINSFDLRIKLYQINKSVSNSEENIGNRVGLPAKSSSAKLYRYTIASI